MLTMVDTLRGGGRALPALVFTGVLLLLIVETGSWMIRRSALERDFEEFTKVAESLESGHAGGTTRGRPRRSWVALDSGDIFLIRGGVALVEFALGITAVVLGIWGWRRSSGRDAPGRRRNLVGLIGGAILILIAAYLAMGLMFTLIMAGALP